MRYNGCVEWSMYTDLYLVWVVLCNLCDLTSTCEGSNYYLSNG